MKLFSGEIVEMFPRDTHKLSFGGVMPDRDIFEFSTIKLTNKCRKAHC